MVRWAPGGLGDDTVEAQCRQIQFGRHLPRRNTRYQAGATPYLGRTFTGRIAPASPGALLLLRRSGLSPHTPCQSPGALTNVSKLVGRAAAVMAEGCRDAEDIHSRVPGELRPPYRERRGFRLISRAAATKMITGSRSAACGQACALLTSQ